MQDAWQAVPLCPYGSAISIDVVTVFDASITGNLDIHFRGPVNAVYIVQGGGFVGLVVAKFRDGTQDSDFFTPTAVTKHWFTKKVASSARRAELLAVDNPTASTNVCIGI